MRYLLIGCVLVGVAAYSNAATIEAAGSVMNNAGNEIVDWRTAGTVKSMDGDGDNIYGSDGYVMYYSTAIGSAAVKNSGSYDIVSRDSITGGYGYLRINDPDNPGNNIEVGTTATRPSAGVEHAMMTFEVQAGAPQDIRVGILVDCLDPGRADLTPASIGLEQVGGSKLTQAITANNVGDMYFFDLKGVQAGDQFSVIATPGSNNYVTHSLVTFDAVPEPSTMCLLAAGSVALLKRRKKAA